MLPVLLQNFLYSYSLSRFIKFSSLKSQSAVGDRYKPRRLTLLKCQANIKQLKCLLQTHQSLLSQHISQSPPKAASFWSIIAAFLTSSSLCPLSGSGLCQAMSDPTAACPPPPKSTCFTSKGKRSFGFSMIILLTSEDVLVKPSVTSLGNSELIRCTFFLHFACYPQTPSTFLGCLVFKVFPPSAM